MDFDFLQSFSSLSLYVTNKVVASNALQKMLNLIFQNFRQKKTTTKNTHYSTTKENFTGIGTILVLTNVVRVQISYKIFR